jgi:hypothetical protein
MRHRRGSRRAGRADTLMPVRTVMPVRAVVRGRAGRPFGWNDQILSLRPPFPASPVRGLLACCLCTNMWMTCAQRRRACVYTVEMLGIPQPDRNLNRAFTWESANHTLCIKKKLELSTSHTAIHDELAEHLSQIYTFVI